MFATTSFKQATRPPIIGGPALTKLLGVDAWRSKREVRRHAAIAAAAFGGVAEDDEGDIQLTATVGYWESLRQRIDSYLATRPHNVRHRASNRFAKRVKQTKILVSQLKFETHGFDSTPNDRKALQIAAKGVVERAVKSGGQINEIEANWYKKAVVALYYYQGEDDEFFDALMPALKEQGK